MSLAAGAADQPGAAGGRVGAGPDGGDARAADGGQDGRDRAGVGARPGAGGDGDAAAARDPAAVAVVSRRANRAAPAERAAAFNAAWSSSVDGILAAAAVLVAADRDLDAGILDGEDHEAFVAGLSVSDKTVIKIRKIGLDVRIHGSR